MEMPHDQQKPPDGLGEQRTANELVKLIRKLRWMGLEREAEKVENQLILRKVQAADSVDRGVARDRLTPAMDGRSQIRLLRRGRCGPHRDGLSGFRGAMVEWSTSADSRRTATRKSGLRGNRRHGVAADGVVAAHDEVNLVKSSKWSLKGA